MTSTARTKWPPSWSLPKRSLPPSKRPPTGEKGTTAPYGNIDGDFDIPELAKAAGATFTGRGDCYHVPQMVKLIEQGINHHGISIIEGVSICPTYYGRKNKKGGPLKMMHWQADNCVDIKKAEKMTPEQLEGKVLIGKFHQEEGRPEYCDEYDKIIHIAGGDK